MQVEQIDAIGAQAPQAVLDRVGEVIATGPVIVRTRPHARDRLGGEYDLVASPARGQDVAHDGFGQAATVDIGGVDEVDPGVERFADDLRPGLLILRHADVLVPRQKRDTRVPVRPSGIFHRSCLLRLVDQEYIRRRARVPCRRSGPCRRVGRAFLRLRLVKP